MGAFLSVTRGSEEPPVFLELYYNGCPDKKQLPLMLSMDAMRADMGGAATVCASIVTAAALKLPVNIIGGLLSVHPLLSGSILVYLEKHHPCFCFDQVWPRCVRTCPVERPPNQVMLSQPRTGKQSRWVKAFDWPKQLSE
ncbi:hypothetical protein GOODEAATRI_011861 [Goodea atripinnis]|uniref:Cytosol aminopeptidase domain-containing protein n=1 Tax=Goodea atripinnis TaxID=208336 RepID=A0ABV0NXB1_9TELE